MPITDNISFIAACIIPQTKTKAPSLYCYLYYHCTDKKKAPSLCCYLYYYSTDKDKSTLTGIILFLLHQQNYSLEEKKTKSHMQFILKGKSLVSATFPFPKVGWKVSSAWNVVVQSSIWLTAEQARESSKDAEASGMLGSEKFGPGTLLKISVFENTLLKNIL